jgi:hypothetical protein
MSDEGKLICVFRNRARQTDVAPRIYLASTSASSPSYYLLKAEPDSRIVKGKDVKVCFLMLFVMGTSGDILSSSVLTISSKSRPRPGKGYAILKRGIS